MITMTPSIRQEPQLFADMYRLMGTNMQTTAKTHIICPQVVKSVLVKIAYRVRATVTPAVMPAAAMQDEAV